MLSHVEGVEGDPDGEKERDLNVFLIIDYKLENDH